MLYITMCFCNNMLSVTRQNKLLHRVQVTVLSTQGHQLNKADVYIKARFSFRVFSLP